MGILIFLLVVAGIGGLVYVARDLKNERHRQDQENIEKQRKADQGREKAKQSIKRAIAQGLKRDGLSHFRISELKKVAGVPDDLIQEATWSVFETACRQRIAENEFDARRRSKLATLAIALGLDKEKSNEFLNELAVQVYRGEVQGALEDGRISSDEAEYLESLRKSLGLTTASVAFEDSDDKTYNNYFGFLRSLVLGGESHEELDAADARYRAAIGLSDDLARKAIEKFSVNLFRQCLVGVLQDGVVTNEEETSLEWLAAKVKYPENSWTIAKQRIERCRLLERFRNGDLPSASSGSLFDSGEICHWHGTCEYVLQTEKRGPKVKVGDCRLSSNRLIFTSTTGGFELAPSTITDIERTREGVFVSTSRAKGTGVYATNDDEVFEAILFGVVRKHKYLTTVDFSSDRTRHIPDRVKQEVWARDGGKCVRCSNAEYLEFDHVIPFSKGGSNSTQNVQVLCRKCNLEKSDRI